MEPMPKIDDRSPPIRIGEAARERLTAALDREHVVAAYLSGSQAAGTAGPLSDVDVAVVADPSLSDRERFELRLELAAEAGRTLATSEVDVVVLNDAPPLLRQRVIRDGALLVERDARERIRFATRALLDYLDTKPLRDELAAGLRHRLEEDRFGRR